ncbi:MAG: universal stress protein [Sulfuricaulis sp.]|uniref:universal stress protein n=1 Tax=Sulfuricaulis sp. TaxID=2003553 RepID=UPI003C3B7602
MIKLLVAVDGSDNANRAAGHVLQLAQNSREPLEVHVLTVQPPVTFGDIKKFVSQEALNAYYHDEGAKALATVRQQLDKSSVAHTYHIVVGTVPETIVNYAHEHGCAQIVMGTRGLSSVSSLLLGSVASKVLHLTDIPVTFVK